MKAIVAAAVFSAALGIALGVWLHKLGAERFGPEESPTPSGNQSVCKNCAQNQAALFELQQTNADLQRQVSLLRRPPDRPTDVGDSSTWRPIEPADELPTGIRLCDPSIFKTWNEFYAHAHAWKYSHEELTDAVLLRVTHELSLEESLARSLKSMILCEQGEVSMYATSMCDDWGGLEKAFQDRTFLEDISTFRGDLRFHDDRKFATLFTPEAMEVINRHLRTEAKLVLRKVEVDGVANLKAEGGVGRP